MHVIDDAANFQRRPARSANDAAEVRVHFVGVGDYRLAVLRPENDVRVEGCKRMCHFDLLSNDVTLSPLRGSYAVSIDF